MVDYKKKWRNVGLINNHYVVGITAILYSKFKVIINIFLKGDDIPHCTYLDFTKMSTHGLGKRMEWVYYKYPNYEFRFMCKADYDIDKFIHAPTFTYNEVNQLLVLANIVEWK